MSITPKMSTKSLQKNEGRNPKLIIISKGSRVASAKNNKEENINYITLKEGGLKLTMQVNNNSINRNDIAKVVKNIKSQNLKNSKSNINLFEDKNLKEKKYLKILHKEKEIKKNRMINFAKKEEQIYNVETTRNNNFFETNENKKDSNDNIMNKKLEINIPTEFIEDNKFNERENNDEINDDLIINKKIDKQFSNKDNNIAIKDKEENFQIKISDILETNNNENNNNIFNNLNTEEKPLSSRDVLIDGKNEDRIKISKENSINNYFEELKRDKDTIRSKEIILPFNNNLMEKKESLSNINIDLNNKSEKNNNNKSKKINLIDPSPKALTKNKKEDYEAQNLITEMDPGNNSHKASERSKNDLISDNKTIKIDEDKDDSSEEDNNKVNIIKNINIEEKKKGDKFIVYNININGIKNSVISTNVTINNNNKNNNNKNNNNDDKKNEKNRNINCIPIKKVPILYNICQICEHTLPVMRLFCAECNKHFLCKKCAKNYYEEVIENGTREIGCPFIKCRKPVDLDNLKEIISNEHFNILTKNWKQNQKYLLFAKLKTETAPENLELYTEKYVIDIDSNKKFYSFNNIKGVYCPKCCKDALFSKTNSFFFKCLYCENKICKYCSKPYSREHLDLNNPNHCKVYYRNDDNPQKKRNICISYLEQLFFVLATYFLFFAGMFLLFKGMFSSCFKIKENKNCFKFFFVYLFTIICFLIVFPFIFIFFPVFPSVLAAIDY